MSARNKPQKAQQDHDQTTAANTTRVAGIAVALLGFGPVLAIALVCLLGIAVAGVTSAVSPSGLQNPSANPSLFGDGSGDLASALIGGSGQGELAEEAVPRSDLVPILEDAGRQCSLISSVVLAAQIQVESNFDPGTVGMHGERGLSQLTPAEFAEYGQDDDGNGEASVTDAKDSIFAQARYLCALGSQVQGLLAAHRIEGDQLTLTLLAWDAGLGEVLKMGGMPVPDLQSYPFQVRTQFAKFEAGSPATTAPSNKVDLTGISAGLSRTTFSQMFPSASSFDAYSGLVSAMAMFPAFAASSHDSTAKREMAAFLANVDRESGGLVYVQELNSSNWGNYCDESASYGCPAGRTAYHGRGPLQLTWNTNYKAAGDAIGADLLHQPDLINMDASIAWETAVWYWMAQPGPGATTAHTAITTGKGFGETVRSINGALECAGRDSGAVQDRVDTYRRFCSILGVDPGTRLTC